ncbi:MAG TPA: hypothetical protein PKD95_03140 [Candidatus Paceibacterota bacterium]|nr:hypothetical protein [Candidatus Paceibacterota bacterium]
MSKQSENSDRRDAATIADAIIWRDAIANKIAKATNSPQYQAP